MEWKRPIYCTAVGAFTAGPVGALMGAVGGLILEAFLFSDNGTSASALEWLNEGEKRFMPVLMIFAAASAGSNGIFPKARARATAIAKSVFPKSEEGRLTRILDLAMQNKASPAQCAQVLKGGDQDFQFALARDLYSVLHADSPKVDEMRHKWLLDVVQCAGLSHDLWATLDAFYYPMDFSEARVI